jgi:hypothetical protein
MSIVLTAGAQSIELHDDLYWEDEFWTPVMQAVDMSARGVPIIHVGSAQAGRPITLRPWSENDGLITRATLQQLVALSRVPGQRMTLALRGEEFLVEWRHQDRAIDWRPFVYYSDAVGSDYVHATLRFMTVV